MGGKLTHPSSPREATLMIAHTTLPVSDYRRSKTFYSRALEPLG